MLNLQKRKIVLYRNNNCFIDDLGKVVNNCSVKLKKGAYIHHFETDQIFEIENSIERLQQMFYFYKHEM